MRARSGYRSGVLLLGTDYALHYLDNFRLARGARLSIYSTVLYAVIV